MSVDHRIPDRPEPPLPERGVGELGEHRTWRDVLARVVAWARQGHPDDYGPHGYVPVAALLPHRDDRPRRP